MLAVSSQWAAEQQSSEEGRKQAVRAGPPSGVAVPVGDDVVVLLRERRHLRIRRALPRDVVAVDARVHHVAAPQRQHHVRQVLEVRAALHDAPLSVVAVPVVVACDNRVFGAECRPPFLLP